MPRHSTNYVGADAMKIAAFLISPTALAIIAGLGNSDTAPLAWFNWSVEESPALRRLTFCTTVDNTAVSSWLTAVRAHDCAAVLMLTSGDDPYGKYFGTDSERDFLSISVDMLDATDLRRLGREISVPESAFLGQWMHFALGAGDAFGWLYATRNVWRAYADGLRAWGSEPSARNWLTDLNAVDYTPMTPDLALTPEDFDIPTTLTPEQARDSYFPSIYNPAFAVGFANGKLETFGIRSMPDEWSFDKTGLIQATLIARVSRRIGTPRSDVTHLVHKGLEAAKRWHLTNGARRARWVALDSEIGSIAASSGSSALTCILPPHNKINITHDQGYVYIHPEIRNSLTTRPLLVLTTEAGDVQTVEITVSDDVITIDGALAEIHVYIGDEAQ